MGQLLLAVEGSSGVPLETPAQSRKSSAPASFNGLFPLIPSGSTCVHPVQTLFAASVPFHRVSVHLLLVVQQAVGCARDRNGGVQAQRFSCGQDQLTLQLQLVILNTPQGNVPAVGDSIHEVSLIHHKNKQHLTEVQASDTVLNMELTNSCEDDTLHCASTRLERCGVTCVHLW